MAADLAYFYRDQPYLQHGLGTEAFFHWIVCMMVTSAFGFLKINEKRTVFHSMEPMFCRQHL
jgi:hypothetical protein